MRRRWHTREGSAAINMTPMLDIVFILLIFFIVTTSFVRESAVAVQRAEPGGAATADDVVAVRIDADGRLFVGRRATTPARARALIEAALATRPGAPVVILASREADAGVLVGVIDAARLAGAGRVALAEDAAP